MTIPAFEYIGTFIEQFLWTGVIVILQYVCSEKIVIEANTMSPFSFPGFSIFSNSVYYNIFYTHFL